MMPVRRFLVVMAALGAVAPPVVVTSTELAAAAPSQRPAPISGGGSSFAQLEIEQWRADVARPPYNLRVDYQSAGSTFGRQKYLSGQLDWGQSDITFQPSEQPLVDKSPRKNFVYVPTSAGGLGFMYNLIGNDGRRITNLRVSQATVCRMFTEENMMWNDPALVAENPGLPLPNRPIRPVVRSDGSGTSYVFSAFCIANAPQVWQAFISLIARVAPDTGDLAFRSGAPTSQWPSSYGLVGAQFAADGVADFVANDVSGRDAITYNEAGFALERGLPNAYVRNAAGVYLLPEAKYVSVALAYATGRPDGTFTLNYTAPDPEAYFPSTYSYAIAQTTGFDPNKGLTLATFLNYAVTKGQERAEKLGYARLSTVLVNLALDQIVKIPGAPPRPTDLAGAPPPPRALQGVPNVSGGSAGQAGPAQRGPAARGGSATAGGGAAAGSAATVVDPATGAVSAGGETTAVAENEFAAAGEPTVDVSNLPSASVGSQSATRASASISDKDALWTFVLGFALVGLGTLAGSRVPALARARRGEGRT
jgi:phosphate transport system substrate-binding protein